MILVIRLYANQSIYEVLKFIRTSSGQIKKYGKYSNKSSDLSSWIILRRCSDVAVSLVLMMTMFSAFTTAVFKNWISSSQEERSSSHASLSDETVPRDNLLF